MKQEIEYYVVKQEDKGYCIFKHNKKEEDAQKIGGVLVHMAAARNKARSLAEKDKLCVYLEMKKKELSLIYDPYYTDDGDECVMCSG